MELLCTRPNCTRPSNLFPDLNDSATLTTVQQKYCTSCGMPLILVGRYLPSRLLGKGGFGAAFLARDRYTTSLRECVVKQFQPSGDLSQKELEIAQGLFQREAEVLEKLGAEHKQIPNSYAFFPLIVPGFQSQKEDQFFYLVQEYIDGEDLEQELEHKGQLSEDEVKEILTSILPVLQFVHENGSIHRDIKPSNIMRSKSGRLYLLDFGAVKQVTTAPAAKGRSTGIYSMGYAPPEQMQGSQVFPSTDLYALAVTCLTLLTGKEPEDLYNGLENEWDWRSDAPNVSDDLAEVLNTMLRPSPKERFQSAQEVLHALFANPTPSSAPPAPPLQQGTTTGGLQSIQGQPQAPTPPSTPASAPAQTPSTPSTPAQQQGITSTPQPRFSTIQLLSSAAFAGFEGALLFIAFGSLFSSPGISMGLWGASIGGLIYAVYCRWIEGKDLPIIAAITLLMVLLIPPLRDFEILSVIMIAVLAGAGTVAVMALFRLVYKILSNIL